MKRCPQCNRVESDDTLVFCRTDGTALVNDSLPPASEAGTVQLSSSVAPTEIGTRALPHTTNAAIIRNTGPTTVLVQPALPVTHELTKFKFRKVWIAVAIIVVTVAICMASYFVFVKRDRSIHSIAVLPFENRSGSADSEYLSVGLVESII